MVGEVVAALRIESDGHVSGYRILKGLEGCNNEARRLINTMPQWKPAGIAGKGPVASIVTVSIPFMALAVAGGDLQVIDEVYVDEGEESAAYPKGLWYGNLEVSQVDRMHDGVPVAAGGAMRLNAMVFIGADGAPEIIEAIQ